MQQQTVSVTEGGIIIIGGGQAGGWAAKTLRENGYTGILTIVSDEPYDFYERPPLSKAVLLDSVTPPLSRLFSPEQMESLQINWRRPARADAIFTAEQQVVLNSGEHLQYQQLLIATGGTPRLPVGEWANHPHILTLRTWDDALRLKTRLQTCQRLAIIGGGWIGLEIAASARKLGIAVEVFERQPMLCMRSVGPEVSQALLALHQTHGVNVHCNCGDIALSAEQDAAWISSTSVPESCFDLAVVGIGVELNLHLAWNADLDIGQGIIVDGSGRTSNSNIFAAGDVAQHPELGLCLQSWAYAQNQAITTAKHMLNLNEASYCEPAWLWSDQYDQNIQILGIPQANMQCISRITPDAQVYFYLTEQCQLVQMVAFNDARAIKLGKRWLATKRVLNQQQLADPTFSLMQLK